MNLSATPGAGVGMTIDMVMARRGQLLLETLQLYDQTYGRPHGAAEQVTGDLLLLPLIFAVAMPRAPLPAQEIVLMAREHAESTLAPLYAAKAGAWTEGDSIAARAYVAALAQIAPWKRPLEADPTQGLPQFDQLDTRERWRLNLPAALLCPAAACPVPERLAEWRTRFLANPPQAPIRPVHLRSVHQAAFAKVRRVVCDVRRSGASARVHAPSVAVARTAFELRMSEAETSACMDLGKFLCRELQL